MRSSTGTSRYGSRRRRDLPHQPWAEAKRDAHFDTYLDPPRLCIPQGVPRFAYGGGKLVVQRPGLVAMLNSQAGWYRLISTDGRPHVGSAKGMPGGQGLVEGGEVPYLPEALAQRDANFQNRAIAYRRIEANVQLLDYVCQALDFTG